MQWRTAFQHPAALTILLFSLLVAGAALLMPAAPWSSRSAWLVAVGVLGYLAMVGAVVGTRPERRTAAPREVDRIRQAMLVRLQQLKAAEHCGGNAELARILSDAIAHLDHELLPMIEQIVERNETLAKHLKLYEQRRLAAPDPLILERLRAIQRRQQDAIDVSTQQVANAFATLLAVTYETDETAIAKEARRWAEELHDLDTALAGLMHRGEDDV